MKNMGKIGEDIRS